MKIRRSVAFWPAGETVVRSSCGNLDALLWGVTRHQLQQAASLGCPHVLDRINSTQLAHDFWFLSESRGIEFGKQLR